jgi:hypothetical protein
MSACRFATAPMRPERAVGPVLATVALTLIGVFVLATADIIVAGIRPFSDRRTSYHEAHGAANR